MRELAARNHFDKHAHLQGCVRLPLALDANRLGEEVAALPGNFWGTTAGRVGVHRAAEAVFLRGYAPAEGNKPIEDRPALNSLPYLRSFLEEMVPAQPLRALLARLPAGATIPPHVDRGSYFANSIRIHVPVETNDRVWMLCAGKAYRMVPGEIWVLNNGAEHGVWNRHESLSRTHLICDFLPTEQLLALLEKGEWGLGIPIAEADKVDRGEPASRTTG
jgi:hypothetical protein